MAQRILHFGAMHHWMVTFHTSSSPMQLISVYSIGILFDFIIMLILLSSCPFLVDFICWLYVVRVFGSAQDFWCLLAWTSWQSEGVLCIYFFFLICLLFCERLLLFQWWFTVHIRIHSLCFPAHRSWSYGFKISVFLSNALEIRNRRHKR